MVRKYKRKSEQKSYSADDMIRALRAIAVGSSIRAASRDFGIPESTLRMNWTTNQQSTKQWPYFY